MDDLNAKTLSFGSGCSNFFTRMSFLPQDYIVQSAWLEHGAFAGWLVEALAPRCFVELGTHNGFSYFTVCQAVQKLDLGTACYAVDTWAGDEHAGFYDDNIYAAVAGHNEKYRAFSRLIRATFADARNVLPDGSVDLLHVDGRHFYEDVKEDFESWRPKLTPDAVVLFHDTNVRENNFGVWKFFAELKGQYRTFEFHHGHGLGVLAIGEAPAALGDLLVAHPDVADAVRNAYAQLGMNAYTRWQKLEAESRATQLAIERDRLAWERDKLASDREAFSRQMKQLSLAAEVDRDAAAAARKALHDIEVSDNWRLAKKLERHRVLRTAFGLRTPSGPAELIESDDARAIRATELFNENFYRANNGSVIDSGMNAAEHFATIGWKMGLKPNPFFDPAYYLATYPDVGDAKMNPLLHFAEAGWREGRRPSEEFDPAFYLRNYPDVAKEGGNPLVHFLEDGQAEGRLPLPAPGFEAQHVGVRSKDLLSIDAIMTDYGLSWAPVPIFTNSQTAPTLTILTDSIADDSLFGGVGTAIVIGTLLAQRLNMRLRLATRTKAPDPSAFNHVLEAHLIDWSGATEFSHLALEDANPLPFGPKDIMFTTSWWTTRAALGSIPRHQILYLLQEDERMFYPEGDMRLRCLETLNEPGLRLLVNTRLLFDHLGEGPDRLADFDKRAIWFDPAFPTFPKRPEIKPKRGKKDFFFYARPTHPRNLYWRGLEVIEAALRDGLLPPDEWDFHFVGHGEAPVPPLFGGARAIPVPKLPWREYAALVSKMDLGLSLMSTPHPSYPPIDLAAAGVAVVTNSYGQKQSLDCLSRNIIVSSRSVEGLSEALRSGVTLANDPALRTANCEADNIPRVWGTALRGALDRLYP